MSKYNFNGAVINANKVVINNKCFDWKFLNVVINNTTTERHYKCTITGCYKCKEFKIGGTLKSITYSLPNSEKYNIKTEEELLIKLKTK